MADVQRLPKWLGIVLAGGASTRMGEDKAMLVFDNATLLDRAIELLLEFGADPIIVSGDRPEHDGVPDLTPGLGPLGGLHSVLSARPELADRWRIVIPVDMPRLDRITLARLAATALEHARGAIFDHRPLPMVLAPGDQPLKMVDRILAGDGRHSLLRLADQLDLVRVEVDPNDRLENINRPEDYRGLCA
jgi:molybdenum cofactor guanylyltransferase